jgi:general stress protein YciG
MFILVSASEFSHFQKSDTAAGDHKTTPSPEVSRSREEHETVAEMNRTPGKRGPKPGTAEARRGGEAVRAKYGREFFSSIGKKGGDTVRREHGSDFYAKIGKKGGETTKARQGHEFYARIGKKGGESNRARLQPEG